MNEDTVRVTLRQEAEVLARAANLIERVGPGKSRRLLHYVGAGVVAYMFLPNVFISPERPENWLLASVSMTLILFVWKGSAWINLHFARQRVAHAPTIELIVDAQRIVMNEGKSQIQLSFAGGMRVYEDKDLLAVDGERGLFLAIPRAQLDEEQNRLLCGLLERGLGERYIRAEKKAANA